MALAYLDAWLRGNGAVAINNLMEDAATAEISRSQIWQWVHNDVVLDTGEPVTAALVRRVLAEQVAALESSAPADHRLHDARDLFDRVALADDFIDFLTWPAYDLVTGR